MTELSSEARQLIDLTRSGDDPAPADRARIDARLAVALAGGSVAAARGLNAASGKSLLQGAKLAWLGAAAVLGSTVLALVALHGSGRSHEPASATAVPAADHVAPAMPDSTIPVAPESAFANRASSATTGASIRATSEPQSELARGTQDATPKAKAKGASRAKGVSLPASAALLAPAAIAADSGLARELALLATARDALREGHAAAALTTLAVHEQEFPSGAMREERLAAQALASCALTRYTQGQQYLTTLVKLAPGSPLLARARSACQPNEP